MPSDDLNTTEANSDTRRELVILLPAYNEERSVDNVIEKIFAALSTYRVRAIVCNDGSSDQTATALAALAEIHPIEIVTHSINRGLGETMRDLFERVIETIDDDGVIVRLVCDDSHEPEYIPAMLNKLDEGHDVVIASRFQDGGGQLGVTGYRKFISYGANLYMKLLFNVPGVKDYTCGFRAYRATVIKQVIATYGNNFVQLKGLGFTCTLEKLVKLRLMKCRFAEVPFILRYDQKLSESKMVSSITALGYVVMAILYHWPWGGWRSAGTIRKTATDQR